MIETNHITNFISTATNGNKNEPEASYRVCYQVAKAHFIAEKFASVDNSTRAPWITLNEQHIMACTSTTL
jgi:predicted transcriptional regulator of viral defense system